MRTAIIAAAAALMLATGPAVAFGGSDTENKNYNDNIAVGEGGNSKSKAGAAAHAGSASKAGAASHSAVLGSGNSGSSSDATSVLKNRTSLSTSQTGIQGQLGIQKSTTGSQDVTVEGDDHKTTVVDISAVQLGNLPTAVCQGSSWTASANFGTPAIGGGGIGFGDAEESRDCNIRENMKLMNMLVQAGLVDAMMLVRAGSQLTGFEDLAAEIAAEDEAREAKTAPISLVQVRVSDDDYDYGRD